MKNRKYILTEGPVTRVLFKLTWPMTFGMLGMVIFNLVDTYFVGKIGLNELAAIGFTFPVIMFVQSISFGMGIGTSSLISRMIVSVDRSIVQQYAVSAIVLSVSVIIIFVSIGQLTIEPLFRLLGASQELIPLIKDYMVIWYWGMIFVVVPMVGNNIIRATGDTFTPGMIMVFSAILNTILDPLFIFGYGPFPELGLKGAAIATVISRSFSMILSFYILIKREKLLVLFLPGFRKLIHIWKKILYIAGPASLGTLITPLSIAIITRLVASYGEAAIAAFGIVSRLEMFALLVLRALASVMTIFAGQHWGSKKIARLRQGIKTGSLFSLFWGIILLIVFSLFATQIAGIFSSNSSVIEIAAKYFIIVAFSYSFQGIMMVGISTFNGVNKPMIALGIIAIRMVGLYIPLAWIASSIFGITGIFWSSFIANILTGTLAYFILLRKIKLSN